MLLELHLDRVLAFFQVPIFIVRDYSDYTDQVRYLVFALLLLV